MRFNNKHSIEATATKEQRQMIAEGRRKAAGDSHHMETWAANGCVSGREINEFGGER